MSYTITLNNIFLVNNNYTINYINMDIFYKINIK